MCRCPKCDWPVFLSSRAQSVDIECPNCQLSRIQCDGKTPPSLKASKSPDWWVRILSRLQTPDDRGIGDTVQRIAAKFGGERFKRFSQRIGIPCGCTDRQERWNAEYPNPHYRG